MFPVSAREVSPGKHADVILVDGVKKDRKSDENIRFRVPNNIVRFMPALEDGMRQEFSINIVYEDLNKWVKAGCKEPVNFRRGNIIQNYKVDKYRVNL